MNEIQTQATSESIEQIRAFNRFYTSQISALDSYLGSDLTLTQARLLYELAQPLSSGEAMTAKRLCELLAMDAGYVSRELRTFKAKGWLGKKAHASDGRSQALQLTAAGRKAFAPLQRRSREQAAQWLNQLDAASQQRLIAAMQQVQACFSAPHKLAAKPAKTIMLRDPMAGDMGWVVHQHGLLYGKEYRWNWEFEALVASICADFVKRFQPDWERCWMAELDGERVGSVFVVKKNATTAQLRMLILTPQARGLGLGARLTDEAIAFARERGYKKMVLWTNSNLLSARAIYAKRGFKMMKSASYEGFGQSFVSETWELKL